MTLADCGARQESRKPTAQQTDGFSGDGGLATAATLFGPLGMLVDPSGNLYFANNQNQRVRKISAGGIISTYARVPGKRESKTPSVA